MNAREDVVSERVRPLGSVSGLSHPPLGRSRRLDRAIRGESTEFPLGQRHDAAAPY